ncbi:MAG: MAPEG family protein [Rudaea sp.]|uniref:MAPEG family protein n=1 Tax=unclassified Rudaea TaxID=2627037 RepID=UPI0010F9D56E|nr:MULTISPECIES: MAPEG family protein [unclassified Rudaea]MBN8886486.1 MAPEG family protein [Rudaea sp.]MBR0345614.1 MAPEG family protein [Rudaea sp.]
MPWVDLVTLLAVFQFLAMVWLVGRARARYKVRAPATTGDEGFERWFRVQQNTLETLIMFLPSLWIAAHYWSATWMALIGCVYLIGRVLYLVSYVRDPRTRTLGYVLSIAPVGVLAALGIIGAIRSLL